MPLFFYTVLATTILAWGGALFLGSQLPPDTAFNIIVVMFSAFIAGGFTLSLTLFIVLNANASMFANKHQLFRRSAKNGFFLSFCLVCFLLLRAFNLATLLNTLLYIILCLVLYKQLKDRHAH